LTFSDLTVSLSSEAVNVWVGPNGAGKTNALRMIRHLIDGIQKFANQSNGMSEWTETLRHWIRDPFQSATVEISVTWNQADERDLIALFIRAALSDEQSFRRMFPSLPADFEARLAWQRWQKSVAATVPVDSLSFLYTGTIGCQLVPDNDPVLYFRPDGDHPAWYGLLYPQNGIVFELPTERWLSSWSIPLAYAWLQTLSPQAGDGLQKFLASEEPISNTLPTLPWAWSAILEKLKESQNTPHRAPGILSCEAGSRWQYLVPALRRDLEKAFNMDLSGGRSVTLLTVIAHLVAHRVVISEDLPMPSQTKYSPDAWSQFAEPLQSRHLGPYLLHLKNGTLAERQRYQTIQNVFHRLAGPRRLDVRWHLADPSDSDQCTIQLEMVEPSPYGSHATRLEVRGSGHVELAYLSALLKVPGSHVVLLDEPGRTLHPQSMVALGRWLEQERTDLAAEMVLITHSPYLVPTQSLERVTRWSVSNTTTQVYRIPPPADQGSASPDSSTDTPPRIQAREHDARKTQREERWIRSPEWRQALFSSAVIFVDGETELGALPEWYATVFSTPFEATGAMVFSVGGKSNLAYHLAEAETLGLPWIVLVDGDSLRTDQRGNIWDMLERSGVVPKGCATSHKAQCFTDQTAALKGYHVFVMGITINDNFETVVEAIATAPCPPDLKKGALRGRWFGCHTPAPNVICEAFSALHDMTHRGSEANVADGH